MSPLWLDITKGLLYLSCVYMLYQFYSRLPKRNRFQRHSSPRFIVDKRLEDTWNASFPKEFIESQFSSSKISAQQQYKDRYIGAYMNAGVIYDENFLREQNKPSFREPATYTPFAQDYIHHVKRPPPKQFPSY